MAVQWPPSPIVEDEATALAKEHGPHTMKQQHMTEDHSVPSRGSVDQYPIICDPQVKKDTTIPTKPLDIPAHALPKTSKREEPPNLPDRPRPETGLHTPPSSDFESRGRSSFLHVKADSHDVSRTPRSKSTSRLEQPVEPRSRPSVSRLQTDISGDLERMKAGTRRDPSPYSYTRETGTFRVNSSGKSTVDHFLSPQHTTESPVSTQKADPYHQRHAESKESDSSTDSDRKPRKSIRFAEKPLGPTATVKPRKSFSLPESVSSEKEPRSAHVPRSHDHHSSHHRRHHREEAYDSSSDAPSTVSGPKSKPSRSASKARNSPYTSSAEESAKKEHSRADTQKSLGEPAVRRPSSHRRERPRLEEPLSNILAHSREASFEDDALKRVYRVREPKSPMTPPTVTTPNHMEDYFSKAFRDNALRHAEYTPRSSVENTTAFSPPTSPPRTPRSERPGRREYFESPASSPQRTPRHSRHPSIEESQIRDLRAHHSLLSQATAGAAAVASRTSPPASRSSSHLESVLDPSNHIIVTKVRSRPSSPAREAPRQAPRTEPSMYERPRSRATSPERELLKPIVHRADTISHDPPKLQAPSPRRETARYGNHRADSLNYPPPRSRPSSPHRESLKPVIHADTTKSSDPSIARTSYHSIPIQTKRPSTRDGLPTFDLPVHPPQVPPQRTASWTGEHPYRLQGSHVASPLHTVTALNAVIPATSLKVPAPPPLQRSQSAVVPNEILQRPSVFGLPPCPRARPTQGLRDWATIRDVPDFDVCPTCVQALVNTRYRTLLVRSLEKPYNKSTVCALSKPWIRVAITESIRKGRIDLRVIDEANTLVPGANKCEGSAPTNRAWWRLFDPQTNLLLTNFHACSACMGSLHSIFPELQDLFIRDKTFDEVAICDFRGDSKNFDTLVRQLAEIADTCRDRGRSSVRYMQPLVDAIKKLDEGPRCTKDKMLVNQTWHYMSQLPELTICQTCYRDVVFPVKDKPYARDINRKSEGVPTSAWKQQSFITPSTPDHPPMYPISCQLYSERSRRLFKDVINGLTSWDAYKNKIKERQTAQYRLIQMNRMYEEDQKMGWDRRNEIERNKELWSRLE